MLSVDTANNRGNSAVTAIIGIVTTFSPDAAVGFSTRGSVLHDCVVGYTLDWRSNGSMTIFLKQVDAVLELLPSCESLVELAYATLELACSVVSRLLVGTVAVGSRETKGFTRLSPMIFVCATL